MVKIREEMAITFDDVLLVPKKTPLASRSEVDLSTQLTPKIRLKIPIISANMDTVTESQMAIALAKAGGIGIIHRFLRIEDQVREVLRVKRFEHTRITNPIMAPISSTFAELSDIMFENNVTSVLIIDNNQKLAGLVTKRDWQFISSKTTPVTTFMTPLSKLITANETITLEKAQKLLSEQKIEKLPLIDKLGKVVGLITAKDISITKNDLLTARDQKGRLLVGAAVGIKPEDLDRTAALLEAGCDVLVIDIAHGHSTHLIKTLKQIKKKYPECEVIAGNVATYEGAKELIDAGADAIKVGIGPGSLCTTRIVAGSGVPQITAIIDCCRAAKGIVPIIADGGIRYSGDIVKALSAGASSVMVGSFFYGTKESPSLSFYKNGEKFKLIRGMASLAANRARSQLREQKYGWRDEATEYSAEGVEAIARYKGSVKDILQQILGGVRSGFSYSGAINLRELWDNAEFVRISQSGLTESHPHDVNLT